MSLQAVISVSRRYGADPDYVVAGGGNTSWKNAKELFIKASGAALATISEGDFVRMERSKLAAVWKMKDLAASKSLESEVLAALMAARAPGEEMKRPSVETLLHDLLPFAYVVHLHPALVNGVSCSKDAEDAVRQLFGDEVLWIPSTNPGYPLSVTVQEACAAHEKRHGRFPKAIILQNHGIFVAADEVAEIESVYDRVMTAIASRIARRPDFSCAVDEFGPSAAVASALVRVASSGGKSASVSFRRDAEIARLTESAEAFAAVASPYTPDHIVYMGSDLLFVEAATAVESAWEGFVKAKGRSPKLVALRGVGVFGIGETAKSARLAVELFQDAAKIAAYVESFGGPLFMTPDKVDFINHWEAETYRAKISTAGK